MRKVDESAEQAANLRRRRKILGLAAAGLILVCGVGWWQKTAPPADATLVSRSGNAEAARRTPQEMVVYVSGMVGRPALRWQGQALLLIAPRADDDIALVFSHGTDRRARRRGVDEDRKPLGRIRRHRTRRRRLKHQYRQDHRIPLPRQPSL